MKSYSRICRAVYSMPWAMQPEKLEAMLAFLELKMQGIGPSPEVLAEIKAAAKSTAARRLEIQGYDDEPIERRAARSSSVAAAGGGSVAVLPLYGLIMHRGNMMGDISGSQGTSIEQLTAQFRQALADPNVKAIVFDVDSPGGSVEGVDEFASEVRDAKKKKPITAVSNCLMASAAYYIASACSEVVVAPSSLTGSIGVYSGHEDDSKALEDMGVKMTLISYGDNKVEGNSYEPLSDGARAHMQDLVNTYGLMFEKSVAKGRRVSLDVVQKKFGQGRVFPAQQAVKVGMADRVGTLDDVLQKHGVNRGSNSTTTASVYAPEIAAIEKTNVAVTVPRELRADSDDTENVSCECDCTSCADGDCDDCSCQGCTCKGCDCDFAKNAQAQASADIAIAARRRELEIAAA